MKSGDEVDRQLLPPAWQVLLFLGVLVVYNIANDLLHGWEQWLAVALLLVAMGLAINRWKLLPSELGLSRVLMGKGLRVGIVMSAVLALVMVTLFMIHPAFFTDDRYSSISGIGILVSLLYMLIHTVLIEELIFRGIVFGMALRYVSVLKAALLSSVLFGLWHIVPSLHITESSSVASAFLTGTSGTIIAVSGIVIATTIAGLVFCYARIKSGNLLASIIVHWTINGVGLLLAILSV